MKRVAYLASSGVFLSGDAFQHDKVFIPKNWYITSQSRYRPGTPTCILKIEAHFKTKTNPNWLSSTDPY